MKIAFLLDQFPRLSETYFLEQIVGLLQAGHDLDIIATIPGGQPKVHPDVERFDLLARTHYTGLPADEDAQLVAAGRLVRANFLEMPRSLLKLLSLPSYGCMTVDHFTRVLHGAVLFSRFGDTSYDIIHCHYGPTGLMGASLRQLGILKGRIVTTFHGSDAYVYPNKWRVPVYEYLFRNIDLCTVSTDYMKNTVLRLGASADRVRKLPVGLDLKKFTFQPREIGADGVIKLATVARLAEKKGLEYSIRAVARVCKSSSVHIQYRIAGEGPMRDQLQGLIDDLGMKNHIELLSWLDQPEVTELLADSHIFILPSVTARDGNKEGQALVIQEAQAMGLPVIATIHNGVPEGMLDGKSGILVPERDVAALADAIQFLVSHPESWQEMGLAGRAFVEKNYDIDMLNRRLLGMYEELMESGPPADSSRHESFGKYTRTLVQGYLRSFKGQKSIGASDASAR
ncbi:MAG TPA: glycosyltransferase [Haliangium sp.]|nr:glycosyltransferase [Haliangium sp.]